jgi:predicted ATPase
MPESKRIVLSGGPGTGKTSMLAELEERGFFCHHEISREIIREELAKGTDILPWADLPAFSERVIKGRLQQFIDAKAGLNFYDRSMVDSVAYMQKDKLALKPEWQAYLEKHKYYPVVFITGPWRAIFENDHERRESWEQLLHVHEYLVSTYQDLGYEVILLPKLPLKERVDFLLDYLNV